MTAKPGDTAGVIVGLDIGGTKTHAAAFDRRLNQVAEYLVPTVTGGVQVVAGFVLDTVAGLEQQLDGRAVSTIGIGIPGLIDHATGSVRQAVNLGIGDKPLDIVALLNGRYRVPCHIDNDVNVAALGAYQVLRVGDDITDLAYLSIGTGIAAGIILSGRIHRGHRGVAGEIGHFPFVPDGPDCECGLQGCLEAVASGSAIGRQWPTSNGTSPSASLITEANNGNTRAGAILDPIADHLAKAVYLLATAYDVDRIVIGGGVADIGGLLLDTINAGLRRLEARSGFVRSLELPGRTSIKPSGGVGVIGAAILTGSGNRP